MNRHLYLVFLAVLAVPAGAQGPASSFAQRGLARDAGQPVGAPAPGSVKSFLRIDAIPGVTNLGFAVAHLGDVDGDGVGDLAVGDPYAFGSPTVPWQGAVHIVFLNADSSVKATQRIDEGQGGFTGNLNAYDLFGSAVSPLGDVDDDGITELLVGAPQDDVLVPGYARAWLLFLNADGTVKKHVTYSQGLGGFQETIQESDEFGSAFAPLGDIDGNDVPDFVVAKAWGPSSFNSYSFTLRLKPDGTVKNTLKVGPGLGGYSGSAFYDWGKTACGLSDLDGDGRGDYVIADPGYNLGLGELAVLFPNPNATLHGQQMIRPGNVVYPAVGGFTGIVDSHDHFGTSLAAVGDLDGDGIVDLAVGATGDTEGPPGNQSRWWGAVWLLFLNADGTVHGHQKISATQGGWTSPIQDFDNFGRSLAAVGDRNGDGVPDLVVGAPGNDGAFYLLYLNGR